MFVGRVRISQPNVITGLLRYSHTHTTENWNKLFEESKWCKQLPAKWFNEWKSWMGKITASNCKHRQRRRNYVPRSISRSSIRWIKNKSTSFAASASVSSLWFWIAQAICWRMYLFIVNKILFQYFRYLFGAFKNRSSPEKKRIKNIRCLILLWKTNTTTTNNVPALPFEIYSNSRTKINLLLIRSTLGACSRKLLVSQFSISTFCQMRSAYRKRCPTT